MYLRRLGLEIKVFESKRQKIEYKEYINEQFYTGK